ncbi:uncharacterized protein LOC100892654 [Strongylocentrotus purpuratus]|uniref:PABC domain-containing protein n=1 Tax=Strongylocentrotus purpuratus TaxID=7668 RepID=A0A7M7GH97_STRPU|nr:uncharacterized protein LOC100892654 [Strongylocentrotus purpuratus]|eukprot:XP_003726515.1 PREDICTED: uncharacterized protein LOC100892654 [Strongylocentrotus purpuratus]
MMHQPVQSGRLLDTKQVLGEHLFAKVSELHDGKTDRITGMLLEAKNEDVMRMLEDATFLRRRIEGALRVIQEEDKSASGKEQIGEELFTLVSKIEPIQCAKITGMLLELDVKVICRLLTSPSELRQAVQKSLSSLKADGSRREEMGEHLYGLVASRYTEESAAKITGMLLEMSDTQLHQMMQDKTFLEENIRLAEEALSSQQPR